MRTVCSALIFLISLVAAPSASAEYQWQTPEGDVVGRAAEPLAWQCPSGPSFQGVRYSRSNVLNERGELAEPVADERGASNPPYGGFPFEVRPGVCGSWGVEQENTSTAYGGGWFYAQVLGPDHPDPAQRERSSVRRVFHAALRPGQLRLYAGDKPDPRRRLSLVATTDDPAEFAAVAEPSSSCASRPARCAERRLLIKAVPLILGSREWEYATDKMGAYRPQPDLLIPCADDPGDVQGKVVFDRSYAADDTPEERFSLDLPAGQVLALCAYLEEGKAGDPAPASRVSGSVAFSTPAKMERRNLRWRTYKRVGDKPLGYWPRFDCYTRLNGTAHRCAGRGASRVFDRMFGGRWYTERRQGAGWVRLPNVHAGNAYCGSGGAAPCKGDLVRFRYVAGKQSRWNPGQLFDYASGVSKPVRVR